ncbi:MAG: NAD-dependent deacylase [Candidatus Marinimicrobia bacterium]|nr:NAD-dependent deacylase [Candidatus Neomarinimicrobiota bacterium]
MTLIDQAIEALKLASRITAFTGAGISVESGIPPFRGATGLWNQYNPIFLDIHYFKKNTSESWKLIKKIFYDFMGEAKPNDAHFRLAQMENAGKLQAIITQNIDNLHQKAGSLNVYEFHGNSRDLVCMGCASRFPVTEINLKVLPPICKNCGGILKPDFIFFGEAIPEPANTRSFQEAEISDVFILIGTTGEIMPASTIPFLAKKNRATIIEINIAESNFTSAITDIFLKGKATEIVSELVEKLNSNRLNYDHKNH